MPTEVDEVTNLIAGRYVPAGDGATLSVQDPATGTETTRAPRSGSTDVDLAVRAARAAFEARGWAQTPTARQSVMLTWAQRIRRAQPQLAEKLTRESGKTLAEARFEVERCVGYLTYYAALAQVVTGRVIERNPVQTSLLMVEPAGVAAIIVPWNYPVVLLMRSLAPALAAGCTVVVKPASQSSGVTAMLFRLLEGIDGLAPGVVNLVTGPGSITGEALVRHGEVDVIAFTGDVATGKTIGRLAADGVKRVSLELGGKSPNIIFGDANLTAAIPAAIGAIFSNAGQLCTVGSRLLVEASVHDEVVREVRARAQALQVGPGLDPGVDMGPVISRQQKESVLAQIAEARTQAELVTGGEPVTTPRCRAGHFVAPTVFDRVPLAARLTQEEVFGPVLGIEEFRDEEQAVALANGTRFGLAAGVWTENVHRALRVARRIRAGSVWINCYNRLYPEAETGGYRESGIGRAGGLSGITEFQEVKHIGFEIAGG